MTLSTTMMLAILDGRGQPQERQELRRLMQAAGVDAPLQRWRAVGERLELTLLNGKVIYLPEEAASHAQQEHPDQAVRVSQEAACDPPPQGRAALRDSRAALRDSRAAPRSSRAARKPRPGGAHGLHP